MLILQKATVLDRPRRADRRYNAIDRKVTERAAFNPQVTTTTITTNSDTVIATVAVRFPNQCQIANGDCCAVLHLNEAVESGVTSRACVAAGDGSCCTGRFESDILAAHHDASRLVYADDANGPATGWQGLDRIPHGVWSMVARAIGSAARHIISHVAHVGHGVHGGGDGLLSRRTRHAQRVHNAHRAARIGGGPW